MAPLIKDVLLSRDTLRDSSDKGAVVNVRVLLGESKLVAVSNLRVNPLTPINASLKGLGFGFVVLEVLFVDDQGVWICVSDTRLLGLESGIVL